MSDESLQDYINRKLDESSAKLQHEFIIRQEVLEAEAYNQRVKTWDAVMNQEPDDQKSVFRPIVDDYFNSATPRASAPPTSIFQIHIPITSEMLEDFSWGPGDPFYTPEAAWKEPTRLMRLRWRINELRSRCIDAWMVLTGKETLEYREEYDEDEEY